MRSLALGILVWSSPLLAEEPPPATPPAEGAPAPEAAPPTEAPAPSTAVTTGPSQAGATGGVTYDRGFVLSYGEDFELKINGLVQSRWSMAYAEEDQEVADQFSIFRARLILAGHAFAKTDYRFQTEFGRGF